MAGRSRPPKGDARFLGRKASSCFSSTASLELVGIKTYSLLQTCRGAGLSISPLKKYLSLLSSHDDPRAFLSAMPFFLPDLFAWIEDHPNPLGCHSLPNCNLSSPQHSVKGLGKSLAAVKSRAACAEASLEMQKLEVKELGTSPAQPPQPQPCPWRCSPAVQSLSHVPVHPPGGTAVSHGERMWVPLDQGTHTTTAACAPGRMPAGSSAEVQGEVSDIPTVTGKGQAGCRGACAHSPANPFFQSSV